MWPELSSQRMFVIHNTSGLFLKKNTRVALLNERKAANASFKKMMMGGNPNQTVVMRETLIKQIQALEFWAL